MTTTKSCEQCGLRFKAHQSQIRVGWGRYCGKKCRDEFQRRYRLHLVCEECGTEFDLAPSQAKNGIRRFCQMSCYHRHRIRVGPCNSHPIGTESAKISGGNGELYVKLPSNEWIRKAEKVWVDATGDDVPKYSKFYYKNGDYSDCSFSNLVLQIPGSRLTIFQCDHCQKIKSRPRSQCLGRMFCDKKCYKSHIKINGNVSSRGSQNGRAKGTEQQVLEIREKYAEGIVTQCDLAQEYDTTQGRISSIIRGATWKHIGGPITTNGKGGRKKTPKHV